MVNDVSRVMLNLRFSDRFFSELGRLYARDLFDTMYENSLHGIVELAENSPNEYRNTVLAIRGFEREIAMLRFFAPDTAYDQSEFIDNSVETTGNFSDVISVRSVESVEGEREVSGDEEVDECEEVEGEDQEHDGEQVEEGVDSENNSAIEEITAALHALSTSDVGDGRDIQPAKEAEPTETGEMSLERGEGNRRGVEEGSEDGDGTGRAEGGLECNGAGVKQCIPDDYDTETVYSDDGAVILKPIIPLSHRLSVDSVAKLITDIRTQRGFYIMIIFHIYIYMYKFL